jgi:hypothetical protein
MKLKQDFRSDGDDGGLANAIGKKKVSRRVCVGTPLRVL